MADRFVVAAPGPLLEQLAAHLPTWTRNTLRQRLRLGCVDVNGAPVDRADHALQAGDVVAIRAKGDGRTAVAQSHTLPVLFVDDDLCAIDKPAGLLSVSTDGERDRTALALLRQQLGRGRTIDLWPAHRLDRETSGVLLFARTPAARAALQADWRNGTKIYTAIVEGIPDPAAGMIERPLWEDENLRVHVGDHPDAQPARTRFRTVAQSRTRAQLCVELDTGRKHQIRAHLAWLGHPVVGDDRYGSRDRRLCLHAERLEFAHPRDRRRMVCAAPVPTALLAALADGGRPPAITRPE